MRTGLTDRYLRSVPIDDVMAYLAQVSRFDRYQASWGIEQAATFVAETARAIGLADVTLDRFTADGKARWWSFHAPQSWTPVAARLEARSASGDVLKVDHACQPFTIATYSAATPPGGVVAPLVNTLDPGYRGRLNGAVAVVDAAEFTRDGLLAELADAGAIGFVTDAPCVGGAWGPEHPGRVELDPQTSLFGFSLTSQQLALVGAWAEEGATARAVVETDRSASMPVVTGVLPGGRSDGEVWLTGHLCHPRPGANDNASGVAALLGVAAAHCAERRAKAIHGADRTIRFVWAPEFVGTAALLHQRLSLHGRHGLPSAVINLDMVGEDQTRCGGPFVVERAPDFQASLINPIAEHVVQEVFAQTGDHDGSWRAAPLMGSSDHALFAGPNVGCAALQFCHAPDRYNHSAGDSLDKVSAVEMLRSTAAAASLAQILACDRALPPGALQHIVRQWCTAEDIAVERLAQRYDGSDWARDLVQYVRRQNVAMLSLADDTNPASPCGLEDGADMQPGEAGFAGRWEGPLNIRAMLGDLPAAARAAVSALIRADKGNYALLFNFAIRADGRRTRADIIKETSFALRRPVDGATADRLFDALTQSCWVTEGSDNGSA